MQQLLEYGIKLGKSGDFDNAGPGALEKEAEVRDFSIFIILLICIIASGR